MDLTNFFPPEIIDLVKQCDTWDPDSKTTKFHAKPEIEAMAKILWYYIRGGPKMMVVPPELLEATDNLDLNFTMAEYAQPYPEFMLHLAHGVYVLVSVKDNLLITMVWGNSSRQYHAKYIPLNDKSVKEMIATSDLDPEWQMLMDTVTKICTILMWAGVQKSGTYLDEKAYRRSQRSGRFRERNIELIYIKQQVKVIEQLRRAVARPENPTHGDGTVRPHWRRAHMRHVAHGPGHSLRKLKLIPAVFVNKKLFTGEMDETEVVYS